MEILKKIPRGVLVAGVLVIAAALIMYNEPPKDACDAQIAVFLDSQAGRLRSLRGKVNSLWTRTASYCQKNKTLGSCAEFHETVKLALVDIQNSPPECTARLIAQDWVRKFVLDSMTLMTQIAWGDNYPEVGPTMYGWMEKNELAIFCKLEFNAQRVLNDEEWEAFVRKAISHLPHAKELKFDDAFGRSLFGVRCDSVFN